MKTILSAFRLTAAAAVLCALLTGCSESAAPSQAQSSAPETTASVTETAPPETQPETTAAAPEAAQHYYQRHPGADSDIDFDALKGLGF